MSKLYKFLTILLITITIISINVSNASDLKSSRLGIDAGIPNLVGLNFEYLTPLLNNSLAPSISFSYLPASALVKLDSNQGGSIIYWSVGLNFYPFSNGKGLYFGLLYANLSANSTQTGLNGYFVQEGTQTDVLIQNGTAKASLSMNMYFIKVGFRVIWGAFSLAPEVGIGHNDGTKGIKYEITDANYKATGQDLGLSINAGTIPTFGLIIGVAF
ncbi:MAG: hypothetical protein ABSG15_05380 [FCB group bacterium]|jgi:hypothetical protein